MSDGRDFIGYGANPPDPRWPGGARIAININVNFEGGGEHSIGEGDDASEGALNDIGQPALPGRFAEALSKREQDIVELILQGHPTKSIAARLGLSLGTIKNYRRRLYDKLDITTEREIFLAFIAASRPG